MKLWCTSANGPWNVTFSGPPLPRQTERTYGNQATHSLFQPRGDRNEIELGVGHGVHVIIFSKQQMQSCLSKHAGARSTGRAGRVAIQPERLLQLSTHCGQNHSLCCNCRTFLSDRDSTGKRDSSQNKATANDTQSWTESVQPTILWSPVGARTST